VEVPIRLTGDVFSGGLLDQQLVTVSIEAEATHIPTGIDVDVEGMEVGTAVHARDLALPAGATLQTDPEALVLHVVEPASEVAAGETAEQATEGAAEESAEAEA
jgi:large subunit ribosomal protein L25